MDLVSQQTIQSQSPVVVVAYAFRLDGRYRIPQPHDGRQWYVGRCAWLIVCSPNVKPFYWKHCVRVWYMVRDTTEKEAGMSSLVLLNGVIKHDRVLG